MIPSFSAEVLDAIKAHAGADYPNECCGYVLRSPEGTETVFPCKNSHFDPRNYIRVAPDQQIAAESKGTPVALYHSHPDVPAALTDVDKVGSEAMHLPWIVYAYQRDEWAEYVPCGWRAPLLGRPFVHGVLDCYSLVRDYYFEKLQIELPDFDREDEWWKKNQNLYLDNFEKAGFVRVNDLKQHDGILMQINSPVPNHAAVYLGQNIIMHHLYNRLSQRLPYGGYWLKNTYCVVRHKSLL